MDQPEARHQHGQQRHDAGAAFLVSVHRFSTRFMTASGRADPRHLAVVCRVAESAPGPTILQRRRHRAASVPCSAPEVSACPSPRCRTIHELLAEDRRTAAAVGNDTLQYLDGRELERGRRQPPTASPEQCGLGVGWGGVTASVPCR